MTTLSVQAGDTEITLLVDGVFETTPGVLAHLAGEAATRAAVEAYGRPTIRIAVHCYLLRGPLGPVLVDFGGGPAMGAGFGKARDALANQGVAPAEVNRILVTHLHNDHVNGLYDGAAPYFPAAEILVPEAELAFYGDASNRDGVPEARRGAFAAAERLVATYGARVKAVATGEILPGIEVVPLPGHSYGQAGFLVGRGTARVMLWGDALHLGDVQPGDPDLGLSFDLDLATSARSRHHVLARAADEGWTVAGGHVGFGQVSRAGAAFRYAAI